jgi:hypothetical protein
MKYIAISVVISTGATNSKISTMTTNNKKRVTLFIDQKLLKTAKAQAVFEETSLTVLAEKALVKYLPNEIVIRKNDVGKYRENKQQ